ncbi:MAG: hypothetical protein HDR48_02090 [Bacteroides sp.]|nr:hypothetical protein [Bacteroides sp.]
MNIIASYNSDEQIRKESSSGGIFSILANKILSEGGVVYGATFAPSDKWKVNHIRISDRKELWRLRGSKYVFSNIGSTLKEVKKDLDNHRKVLYSGTPCQIATLRKLFPDHPLLLLVEIVCHGAPEQKYWEMYLDELLKLEKRNLSEIKSINFRDKRTGWRNYCFTIQFIDGYEKSEFHGENIFMRGMLFNLTLREGCFKCPFKYPQGSKADITLGDFWGVKALPEYKEDNKGISLIIINSEKGEEYLPQIKIADKITFEQAVISNSAILHASVPNLHRDKLDTLINSKGFYEAIKELTKAPLKIRIIEWIYKNIYRHKRLM